jgi:hypothetical protein
MDSISIVLLISTTFSLITTVSPQAHGWVKTFATLPRRVVLLQNEIRTIRNVIDECFETIHGGVLETPVHVREMLTAAHDQQEKLELLIAQMIHPTTDGREEDVTTSGVKLVIFATTMEEQLNSELAILRDKVGLLRDACSEIRLQRQLVELSAAMAKLTELSMAASVSASTRLAETLSESPSERRTSSRSNDDGAGPADEQRLQIVKFIKDLALQPLRSLEADDFFINGTVQLNDRTLERGMVLVEDESRTDGERFRYKPARVKIDTGSAADFVTRDYLVRVGYNLSDLREISGSNREGVEGLNKTIYMPTHQAEVQWYVQGEAQLQVTSFLVVDSGPFDLLLSSRNFVPLVSSALPLVRAPRKTRGMCHTTKIGTCENSKLTSRPQNKSTKKLKKRNES